MAGCNAISGNTGAAVEAPLAEDRGGRFVVNYSRAGALAGEEEPLRRTLKHGEQYTGRSWLGRKGTVVEVRIRRRRLGAGVQGRTNEAEPKETLTACGNGLLIPKG